MIDDIVLPDSPAWRCDDIALAPDGRRADWLPSRHALGTVVFVHGRVSGRHSLRDRQMAQTLVGQRVACLLPDLLTAAEAAVTLPDGDLDLLCQRTMQALDRVAAQPGARGRGVGLFGGSRGAAVALQVAALNPPRVAAVVLCGGRTDLVESELPRVQAPTLLIVGGHDTNVLALNRHALRLLTCNKRLEVVPHATRQFSEPGTLGAAADLAAAWFCNHFADASRRR